MRKLIFTAIAIFAFSYGSYANNINIDIDILEQKQEKLELITNITSESKWIPSWIWQNIMNCVSAYNDILAANTPIFGATVAQEIAAGAFKGCMGAEITLE